MTNRLRISLVLMMVSMVLLAAFQAWWIYKSYREEKETLDIRTSMLFRETLYGLQASKITLLPLRTPSRSNMVGVVNTLSARVMDSLRPAPPDGALPGRSKLIVSMDRSDVRVSRDSNVRGFVRYAPSERNPDNIFNVLLASESAKDTLKMDEIKQSFSKALATQQIDIPYTIKRGTGSIMLEKQIQQRQLQQERKQDAQQASKRELNDESQQESVSEIHREPVRDLLRDKQADVTIGFIYPMTYQLQLGNTFPYLIQQIVPEVLFALFLLTVTIMSFLMLYRNLVAQRRLAGIKNDFISNITHELKTPIATVSVAIEALKNFNALHDPQKTKEYLDISQNELQRLSLLVDKVLKLSMFENKAIELKPELLDLKGIVEEVAASMRLQLEKYKAQVSIEFTGSSMLRGDKLHLTSVVFNLLDNALKYSKAYPSIRIEITEAQDMVQLVMIDNGIGIAPEYKGRIFEKFFRVPAGDTHNAKGYGLGLSYVAHVVQKHNGTIEVESQPGIGSRFIVNLPKAT